MGIRKPHEDIADRDSISLYFKEMGRYPMISREEEADLFKKYDESSDPDVRAAILGAHLPYVVKVAKVFHGMYRVAFEDLISAGNEGLVHAFEIFEIGRNTRFLTYAGFWVRAKMQDVVRGSLLVVNLGSDVESRRALFGKNQKGLGISQVSLDAPLKEGGTTTRLDLLRNSGESQEFEVGRAEIQAMVRSVVSSLYNSLDERQRVILDKKILAVKPVSLDELVDLLGITKRRVNQIETEVVKLIARALRKKGVSSRDDL